MASYEVSPLLGTLALAFVANQGHEEDFREFISLNGTKLGEEMTTEFDRFISELQKEQSKGG